MQENQEVWILMARCAFNEATDGEKEILQRYLQQDPVLQQKYDWLLQVFEKEPKNDNNIEDENSHIKALNILSKADKLEKVDNRFTRDNWAKKNYLWVAAASIIVLICTIVFYLNNSNKNTRGKNNLALIAPEGTRKQEVLPDGSKIWLNAGSQLVYLNDFKGTTREVKLVGEAFFDIIKNVKKPFIVHVNDISIKVLGTSFNVKNYKEDKEVITTLYRGLVHVSKENDQSFQPIMLYPNQKLVIPKVVVAKPKEANDVVDQFTVNINPKIVITYIDSTVMETGRLETSWMHGHLEFKGESFQSVASKMEHWYNVKIKINDENLKQLNFTGSFEKESIEQALTALQTANPFTFKISGNEVIITKSN